MKILYYLIVLLLPCFACSQAGEWTWMKGQNTPNNAGNFGTMGVPSSTNKPPALYAPAYWTDTAGNLWVYGGISFDNSAYPTVECLWKFDPETLLWTWMKGSTAGNMPAVFAAASGVFNNANNPGAIGSGAFTWTDKKNHLWMYGGFTANAESNDLWQYDPAVNQWAWMNGSQEPGSAPPVYGTEGVEDTGNTPGGKNESNTAWIDSAGNLWLFGGWDGGDDYNDMWRYDISTGMWAWMSGTDTLEGLGNYGPLGVSSANYCPASRVCNLHWQDSEGNFWLAGGWNIYNIYLYTDVWKFNPALLEWTLVKGSSVPNLGNISSGNCQANISNRQKGRFENRATWQICDGLIINYGGFWGDNTRPHGVHVLNDLWAYLPEQNDWLEINEGPLAGNYGAQGISSAQNYPAGREGLCGFVDKNNNIWMFGGTDSIGNIYNDLWRFILDTSCLNIPNCNIKPLSCNLSPPALNTNASVICPTDSAQICAPNGYAYYAWNTGTSAQCTEAYAAGNYYVTAADVNGCSVQSNQITISVLQTNEVSISRVGDTLFAYNAINIQWYLNNNPISGATSNFYIATTPGSYTVQVTDTDGCTSLSSAVIITGIENINADENIFIYPNPLQVGSWKLEVGSEYIGAQVEVLDAGGRVVYKTQISNIHSEIPAPVTGGVYLLRIVSGTNVIVKKLIKL